MLIENGSLVQVVYGDDILQIGVVIDQPGNPSPFSNCYRVFVVEATHNWTGYFSPEKITLLKVPLSEKKQKMILTLLKSVYQELENINDNMDIVLEGT